MRAAVVRGLLPLFWAVTGALLSVWGEPMNGLALAGLPPRPLQATVLRVEWQGPDRSLVRLRTPEGRSLELTISGIPKEEFPTKGVASIEANAFVQPSGLRRMIRMLGPGGDLIGVIALHQAAGTRILDRYVIGPGAPLGPDRQPHRERVTALLKPPEGEEIHVPPGTSVLLVGEGGTWRFTCYRASVAAPADQDARIGQPTEREAPRAAPVPEIVLESQPFSVDYSLFRQPDR